jgi:hypothetical protein
MDRTKDTRSDFTGGPKFYKIVVKERMTGLNEIARKMENRT